MEIGTEKLVLFERGNSSGNFDFADSSEIRNEEVDELLHRQREVGNRQFSSITQLCMVCSFKQPVFTETL